MVVERNPDLARLTGGLVDSNLCPERALEHELGSPRDGVTSR